MPLHDDSINVTVGKIQTDVTNIKEDVTEIKDKYVTKIEFEAMRKELCAIIKPIRIIAYGAVGIILTAFMTAVIGLVIKGGILK